MSTLPAGYKQTEVGVIPEDWDVVDLADIAKKITDGEHVTPQRTSQGYYLLSARNVLNGKIDVTDVDYVGIDEFRRIKQRCNPEAGDVLISCSGTIGRIAVVPTGFECVLVRSAALAKLEKNKADSFFVQHWLQARTAQHQIFTSVNQGAQPNLFLNHIERLKCPKPPLTEQETIAEALSDADAFIESLEQLVAKKRHLKQSTMQELLTGKKRLPGFQIKPGYKKTDVGMIPDDWNIKQLSDLGEFKNGINKASDAFGHGSPFVNLMDVFGVSGIASSESLGLVETNSTEQNTYELRKGDVIFIRSSVKPSGVGLTAVVEKYLPNTVYSGFLIRFRDNDTLNCGYKRHCFYEAGFRRRLIGQSSVSANTNINQDNLKQLLIAIPPTQTEQSAIAALLTVMDAEIAELETQLSKTRTLKQGMMHKLLTGEIRLL